MLAWIVLFPLLGFLINGFWYAFGQSTPGQKKASALSSGLIATLVMIGSFIVSVLGFLQLSGLPEESRMIEQVLFSWMRVAGVEIDVTFRLDSLSSLFTLFITGVGTLIHIYSIGYMAHDKTPGKFFAYLNLFCFAMLILVLGASLPVLFLGWEGVGLCSYLLIGYWYEDIEKASAGKKAFIVNRIGDFGFLLGMFLIFTTFGTFDALVLQNIIGHGVLPSGVAESTITAICLLLFLGCVGKSAQIPLYIWLPDAMAGPTPVSALIHAATMVTSGIYMVARLNFLFSLSPVAMQVVALTGGFTAFLAATIALTQRDIKKVLAYSTVSQLGYMFLGCGVGAYSAGVFHVVTHAFFKALLFLGAGSVIHGMHEEQDILKMGGLRTKMPKTFFVFAIAWLAICGIPPFSGFFSKDEILWLTFSSPHGSPWLWALGALTAVMTAFYMTRLFSLVFLGTPRFENSGHGHGKHVHESPSVMILPLQILALLSLLGGFLGVPHFSWIDSWLSSVIPEHAALDHGNMEWILMAVSVVGAVIGMTFAFKIFGNLTQAENYKARFAGFHKILENKWYVDEFFEATVVRPIHGASVALWKWFDIAVIDRIVLGFGKVSMISGQTVRHTQTGAIQFYAFVLLIGLVATVGYLVYGLA